MADESKRSIHDLSEEELIDRMDAYSSPDREWMLYPWRLRAELDRRLSAKVEKLSGRLVWLNVVLTVLTFLLLVFTILLAIRGL